MSVSHLRRTLRHLPVVLRGRPLHGPERYGPFFIVGSGRCGSTLLRAILQAHAAIHIPPETHVLPRVIRDYRRYSRLSWNVVLRMVLSAFEYHPRWSKFELTLGPVFQELESRPPGARNLAAVLDAVYRAHMRTHKPSASRWGDKTPSNVTALRELHTVFPDLRVVHLLRDGRDVVRAFLAGLDLPTAVSLWVRAVRAARAFAARYPRQYLEIRYEDLVRQPRATLEAVTTFLDLPFDEAMLRHHEVDMWFGPVEPVPSLRDVRGPIHQAAVERWRTECDAAQVAELEGWLGPTLREVGYEPAGSA